MRTDANHIALEKTRGLLNLLRRSSFWINGSSEESSIISKLKLLQQNLRINSSGAVDAIDVLAPFLAILRAPYLAGPYKSAALESIHTFITCDILSECPNRTGDALAEVVDAVTHCKYVQTDAAGDELVQLLIVQVLQSVVKSPVRYYLTDETAWDIVESCHTIILQTGRTQKAALHQVIEQILLDSVRFIFACTPINIASYTQSDDQNRRASFGLPCAMKALGFFVRKLQKYAADVGQSKKALNSLTRNPSPLGDSSLDSDTVELILSLKAIHAMLLAEGNMSKSRAVIMSDNALASMVRDDLAKCLLMISSKREFPPMVLQHVLALFGTLITSLGPAMRIMVECFFVHVYLKGLHQFYDLLIAREESIGKDEGPAAKYIAILATGFSPEELGIIMESLADLVLGRGFLQSLFATFDCDPTKPDIVKPLLGYLSKCTRVALLLDPQDLGNLQELASLCVQTFLQISRLLAERCNNGEDSSESDEPKYNVTGTVRDAQLVDRAINASKYLVAVRKSKEILSEASRLFTEKPSECFKFLQAKGAFPQELTPECCAEFLRIAPGLPKENVGSFLGELGKDEKDCKYVSDGKEFHKQVLLNYVKSFTLTGQSVLNYLRIFLSAFRLPGEAQQIDRILVAFSENCYANCSEKESGIIDNSEVLYLLTFSIIMLNTDLHNPNIRPERKMTLEQFIRNNTNYGSDVNQVTPLAKDYLEGIYHSMAEFPIRTERNDLSGAVTAEMWMDLQFQASMYPEKGVMITTCYSPEFLQALLSCMRKKRDLAYEEADPASDDLKPSTPIKQVSSDASLNCSRGKSPLTVRLYNDTILTPNYDLLKEMPYLVENEDVITTKVIYNILNETDKSLDPLAMSAYIYGADWIIDNELFQSIWQQLLEVGICPFLLHRSVKSQSSGDQGLTKIPKIPGPTSLWRAIDFLVVLLKLAHCHNYHIVVDAIICILADFSGGLKSPVTDSIITLLKLDTKIHGLAESTTPVRSNAKFISSLVMSVSARAALCTLLQVVHNNPTYISQSWPVVWSALSQMRDCSLLPIGMVKEADADLLPARARSDFELRLALSNSSNTKKRDSKTTKQVKKTTSLLSFGDFFFGSGQIEEDEEELDQTTSPPFVSRAEVQRWDSGYEELEMAMLTKPKAVDSDSNPDETDAALKMAMKNLRDLVEKCGIAQLVSDTRFMNESILQDFTISLISTTESLENGNVKIELKKEDSTDPNINQLQNLISDINNNLPPPSESSRSWLEMILVETALRNRDRFSLLWPHISMHYNRMLGRILENQSVDQQNTSPIKFNYSTERRIVGLFKIATRMLARKKVSSSLLDLFGALFITSRKAEHSELSTTTNPNIPNDRILPMPIPHDLLVEVAGQIAAGMWRLLTLNVSVLPVLTLEQWQILFDIISMTASAGGYATIKAFESMAWLLHEPRLRAEVPVFCVVAIKPLLRNTNAPISVSVGAVQLLSHLHMRLEVLVKDDYEEEAGYDNSDTPVLWESCWAPILRALADGAIDKRAPVRIASVDALSNAILDRHTLAVPSAVMIKILLEIVIPTILFLGEDLLHTTETASAKSHLKEINQGEQVLQDVLREDSEKRSKHSGSPDSVEKELDTSNRSNNKEEDFPQGVLQRTLSNVTPTRQLEVGPAMECMSSLFKAFLQQIKKLSTQPNFDILWISILDLLGFFLLSPEHGGKFDKAILSRSPETVYTIDLCYDHLRIILHSMATNGLFGNQYRTRWYNTYDNVMKLNRGSRVFIEVFEDCRRDATPVPKPNVIFSKNDKSSE